MNRDLIIIILVRETLQNEAIEIDFGSISTACFFLCLLLFNFYYYYYFFFWGLDLDLVGLV
jgi:hypothetical protein